MALFRDPYTLPPRVLRRRVWLCRLTDHRRGWHPQDPPYCLRCGAEDYWPARETLGGWWERKLFALRDRWKGLFGFRRCEHCGARWGRHGEDCIPF